MRKLLTLCSVVLFALFPVVYCQAEGSKDMYPSGALGNRAYMTSSSTSTSSLIGNIINPGRMFVYAKAGEVIYIGSSAQGIGSGTTRLVAPNGTVYTTGASVTTGRINSRAEELAGPAALNAGGYTAYNRTVLAAEEGIWTVEFTSPNPASALGSGYTPPAANASWTTANQTAVSALALIVAWDITVASAGIQKPGRVYLNIFTGNAGTASSAFYGKFNVLTKDGFTYTATGNGIQPFLFAFFVNNKGTRDKATGVPVYKSVDLAQVTSAGGAYSFHNPTLPDDATNITQKMFYNPPDNTLPATAPVWIDAGATSTWLISTPVVPTVTNVSFTGKEGTPGQSGTPPLAGGYIRFTANQNGNFKISIDVNNNGSTADPIDRIITGSSVSGANSILWDGKNGQGGDVANGATINISVVLFSGEVHFPYMDVENNVNGIVITRTNGSNAPDPTVYWNDELLGAGAGAPSPINASASPGVNSSTNGHKYTNSYGDNSLLDTWAYIFSAPVTTTVTVRQLQADLQVVNNDPSVTAICVGSRISFTTSIRNNGPDTAKGAKFNFSFPAALTGVTVTPTITGTAAIVSGGVIGNAYSATVNMNNGAVISYVISGTVSAVPAGGNLLTKSSILRPADVTDPDATNAASSIPTDPDVECNGAPSGTGCNNIITSSVAVSPTIGSNTVAAEQSVCFGSTPAPLTGTTIAGTPVYLWQSSTVSATGGFAVVPGVSNGKDYTPPALQQTTWFRRAVTAGSCSDTSLAVMIKVNPVLTPGTITGSQVFCGSGNPVAFSQPVAPGGGTGTYSYRWQSSTDSINFTDISGATQQIYDAPVLSQSTWFRRVVSSAGSGCADVITDTVAVKIDALPTVANAGEDQQLCNVNTATLAANTATIGTGLWSQVAGPGAVIFVNAALPNTGVQNLAPGNYVLTWTIRNGSCAPSVDTVQIQVYAQPDAANAGPDQTKNNSGSFVMSANAPANGTGTWTQVSGTAVIADVNNPNTNVTLQPNISATLVWTISNGNCAVANDTVVLNYIRQADLTVTKSDAGNTYKTGSPLTYTITIENLGPSNVSGFQVQDLLPVKMENASWTSTVSGAGVGLQPATGTGTSVNPTGNLPFVTGNKIVITVTGNVAATAIGGDAIANTATVVSPADMPDPVAANNTSFVSGIVPNNPPVAVTDNFTTNRDVPVSGNVLTNDSDPENQPITVTTTLIEQPSHGTVVQNANGTFTYTPQAGSVGVDFYRYQVCDNQGACAIGTVNITTQAGVIDLSISKTASPVNATAGSPLTYTITVTNNGPSTILPGETFTVTDALPDGFIANSYTPSEGTYSGSNGSWTGALLPPGKSVTLTIAGEVQSQYAGTSLTNSVEATPPSSTTDPTPATTTLVTPVAKSVEVKVTKTDNTTTYTAGTTTTYHISILNSGPSDLTGATFLDPLPTGITVASWTASNPGGSQSEDDGSGPINELVNIPAGGEIVYTLTINIPSGYTGPLTNTASIIIPSGYNNINPAGNSATDTDTPDPQTDIEITKTGPASATAGTGISYQLTIVNKGPSDVAGVVMADQLPAQIQNPVWTITANGNATASVPGGNGAVNFTAGLPAGTGNSIIVNISGTINPAATGNLSNTATATPPAGTPVSSNTVNTTLINTTGLTLVKQGPATGRVAAGEAVSYVLRLVNAGPSDATGVILTDAVPAAITGTTWSVTATGGAAVATGGLSGGTGNNVNTLVNIPAGAGNAIIVQINGTVAPGALDTLTNTATAELPGDTTVTAVNKIVIDNQPGLQIVKAGPATADAGTEITYTITVNNSGPSDALQAVITDEIATVLTNVSWTATASGGAVINSGANGNGNTLMVNANIPAGNNNTVTIVVHGTVGSGADGTIGNIAQVEVTGQPPVNSNEIITAINNKPGLVLTKSGPATADAGGTISYVLQINNNGPSDAFKAELYDTLAAVIQDPVLKVVTNGSASYFTADINNGVLQVTGDIPAGDSNYILVYITGKINPSFTGQITNRAIVGTVGGTPVLSDPVITTVSSNPRVELTKSAPDTAVAGQAVTYTLVATNSGLSDAVNVVITDVVPASLSNTQWTAATTGGATIVSGGTGTGNTVNVTGNIPAGAGEAIVITVQGTLASSATGNLSNHFTATVSGNTVTSDTVQTHIISKPVLQITKTGTTDISAGGRIRYTVQVENTGVSDASGVNISDNVNTIVQNTSWTSAASAGAVITTGSTGNGNTVAVTANIPAGGTVTITIDGTVSAAAAGTLQNTATASVTGAPTVEADVTTLITNDPAIDISKTGPAQIKAGEEVNYQLVITNFGVSNARGIVIQDIVPAGITNVKWTSSLAGSGTIISGATGTGNNVTLDADLTAGTANHIFVNITGKVAAGYTGVLTNYASVVVPGKDTARSDSVTTTVINAPGIQVVKSAPDTIAAGSNITFTVTVTNIGPSNAPAVTIADIVPSAVQNVTWSAVTTGNASVQTGAGSGNNISLNGAVAAGAGNSITLTIQGTVNPAATGDISNTATVTPAGNTPVTSNETTTHVDKQFALILTKTGPAEVPGGAKIVYQVTLHNNGPSDATGLQLKDTVPAAIGNVTWTAATTGNAVIHGSSSGAGNLVSISADLAAGAATNGIVVTIEGTIDPSYTGTPLRNIAYVTSPGLLLPLTDTLTTTVTSLARLVLTKSGPGSAFSGDTITYTIHLSNAGPSDAKSINITDIINPAILQPVWTAVATGTGTTISSTTGAGDIQLTADIPASPGHAVDITVTGKLNPEFTGAEINNTVTAVIAGEEPFVSAVTTQTSRKAGLRVVKSGPANAVAGEKISYTISVTNEGPSNISGATISDVIPTGILQPTWTAVANGAGSFASAGSGTGDVTLQANIPAGTGSIDIVVNGILDPATVSGNSITNTVTVTPPPDMTNTSAATASVVTNVTKEADLVIVKSGPANIAAGQEITYQLVVTNNGISDVDVASITDAVPASIHITNASALTSGNTIAGSPVITGNTVTVNASIPAGPGNNVLITITGTVDPAATGTISNTATVASTVTETNPANNISTVNTNVTTDLGLQVSKSGPASVNVNDQITYTIVLSNNGLSDANEVFVTDNIPAEITGATWSAVVTGNASITNLSGTGSINNERVSLGGSSSGSITITITGNVSPTATNTITNTVTAAAGTTKVSTVVTSVNNSADLRINKTAPSIIAAGKEITYVISVNNAGPADVTGAVITDNVPVGVNNVQWTAAGAGGATVGAGSGSGNAISLTGNIPASSGSITITVKGIVDPAFSGVLSNTATATPPTGVTDPTPGTVTVNTQVTAVPGLYVLKSGPAQIAGGDTVRYTLDIRNNGPSVATGVSIRDSIPVELKNVKWAAIASNATIASGGTGTGNSLNMTGDIPVGGLIRVTITGNSDPAFTGSIMNRAVAEAKGQSVLSNEVNTQIINQPGIAISKSGPANVAAGSQVAYTIAVTNTGISTAQGITVSDVLPPALKNTLWSATAAGSAVISGGNISNQSGNVSFQATIPPGAANTILVTVNGTLDPSASGTLVNVAAVTPVTGAPLTDTVTTVISTVSGIRLVKAAPDTAAAGNTISYTIDVYNDGPSDAVGMLVTDTLPAALQNVRWSATAVGAAAINGGNLQQQPGDVSFIANIPAGTANIIHVVITAVIPSSQTGTLRNQANARAGGIDYPSNDVVTQVTGKPGLQLTKSGPPKAAAGSTINYSLVLSNDGPSDASNVTVTDLLPAELQNPVWSATAQGSAVINGGNITNRTGNVSLVANVPAGAGNRIVVNVSGSISSSFSGNISNTAAYTLNTVTVNTPPVVTVVQKRATIRINKSAPDTVIAGGVINYTLLVANDGPSDADSITITDIVPAAVQQVTWNAVAAGGTLIGAASGAGNNISVRGSIPAGAGNNILVTITGTIAPGLSGIIQNKAQVSIQGNVISEDAVNTRILNKPGVQFTKSGPQKAIAGSNISYVIALANQGPSDLVNASITDVVPPQITDVNWTITLQGNATLATGTAVSGVGNRISFNAGVPAGAANGIQVTITGRINPDYEGNITNKATATDSIGNEYTSTTNMTVTNEAVVKLDKIGPATVKAGSSISYVITASNQGPSNVKGFVITDVVPAAVTNVSWTAVANGNAQITGPATGTGNSIQLQGDMAAGAGNTIQITVNGDIAANVAIAAISNTATGAKAGGATITSPTVTTTIQHAPGISIMKVAPPTVNAGDSLQYVITVANTGPSDATNVKISDVVPAALTNVSWTATTAGNAQLIGAAAGIGSPVNLTVNIAAGNGNTVQIRIIGKITPGFTDSIVNTASATDAAGKTITSTATTQVNSKSVLSIIKTGSGQVNAGDSIHYVITASNAGPSNATGMNITDIVPAAIGQVTWTATANGASQIIGATSGSNANISVNANIAAGNGNNIVINISGVVPANATVTSLSNMATLKPATGDSIPTTPVITTVTKKPSLHIVKQAAATATAGDSLHYNITVTNDGPSDATGIQISDIVSDTLSGVSWIATTTGAAQITGSSSGVGDVLLNGNISAGAGNSINIKISGKINTGFTGSITNTASARDANNQTVTGTTTTQVSSRSALSITKTGSAEVIAGDSIHYVIIAANAGPSNAAGVSIIDVVPAAISGVAWTAVANGGSQVSSGVSGSGNQVLVTGNLNAGSGNTIVINVSGLVPANATITSLSNTATLKPATGDSIPTTPVITTVTKKPSLHIVKQAAATATAGDSLHYNITVTNDGPSDATGIQISDIVSDTLSGVSWIASTTGAAQITGSSSGVGDVLLNGSISAGAGNSINIKISGKINTGFTGSITNTASARDANNQTVTGTATTQVSSRSQLSIVKTGSARINAGDTVRYVIIASNAGPSAAAGINITDVVDAAVTQVTWTTTANGTSLVTGGATGSGSTVSVTGNLDAGNGNTIQVNIKGVIPADAVITAVTNTATLKQGTGTPVSSDPVVTEIVPGIKKLDLSVTKSGPVQLTSNDSITYIIVARNGGPAAGDGAVITDILPPNIEGSYVRIVTATGGVAGVQTTNTGNVAKTTIGTFPAGGTITLAITGKVNSALELRNQAIIAAPAGTVDTTAGNNTSATVITSVSAIPMADLRLQKELLNTAPVQVGGKADFVLTLTNAGPFNATRIAVRDTLKENLDIINGFDASIGEITYDPATRILIWSLDSLSLTQTATLKYTTRVTNTGDVINSATATSLIPDPDPSNNTAVSKVVTVTGDDILVPNVITPNGDGKNDKFIITGILRYPNSSLFIYNRWGNMVYQSKNYQNEWTGDSLNEGTYYYVLKLNTPTGERSYKGWIELLR
ncbi:gliding motility-associated C-terminal domain-containing protein [Chitinophaga sp. RCC_12]|uniref:T9SS type B sorting domain-containing protein n=1 Tax=Chitinophaga sp. RCC_12 TaxID=3239226 RepID=UPI003525168E